MARADVHLPPEDRRSLLELNLEFVVRAAFRETVVVGAGPGVEVGQLDPATGPDVGVGLFEEARPVRDAAAHGAHLDEVEGFLLGEDPGRFYVVDLEAEIWRDPMCGL